MKRALVALVLLFLLAPLASAAADNANVVATLLQYDPVPAEPGQLVTVYVQFENVGNAPASDLVVGMVEQFPFTAVGADDLSEEITLGAQRVFVKEFDVKVDSNAAIGDNKFKVQYSYYAGGPRTRTSELPIEIRSNEAALSVSNVKIEPTQIVPGETAEVTLTLRNAADVALRTIGVQLEMEKTSGTTVTDLPFIPQDSTTEKRVNRLERDQSTQVTFSIQAYPSAAPGFYKLPLTMTYYDDAGTEQTTEDVVGVVVRAVPELKIIVDDTTLTGVGEEGTVTLQFINKGINDLKFLDTELVNGQDYEVIGSGQDYIGDLDSDDYRSVSYTIKATGSNPVLSIQSDYKDENNQEYEVVDELPLHFASTNGESSRGPGGIIVVLIIVAIVGYVIYKRRKRNKRKKK